MPLTYKDQKWSLVQGEKWVDLELLAKKIDEPFYLYDIDGAVERLKIFQKEVHPAQVYFSLKSNNHAPVIQAFLAKEAGLDIVSGGELNLGLELGCSPKKIVFSGVGKTKKELELALDADIFQINVESLEELNRLGEIGESFKTTIPVAIRLNPGIHLKTHSFIQTGTHDHKFGIEIRMIPQFLEIIKKYSPFLNFQGLAVHIGSQGLSIDPIIESMKKIKQIYDRLNREGLQLTTIDIGGGLGIDYRNQDSNDDLKRIKLYGSAIKEIFNHFEGHLICEPGRIIIARFGWLFGEVQYIKQTSARRFAILNTGMNHLIRPVLYQAFHHVFPLIHSGGEKHTYTIAGPICESADVLAYDRMLPSLKSGDWLVFSDTGAYGAVMAQRYNLNSWPKEIAFSQGIQKS